MLARDSLEVMHIGATTQLRQLSNRNMKRELLDGTVIHRFNGERLANAQPTLSIPLVAWQIDSWRFARKPENGALAGLLSLWVDRDPIDRA